MRTETVTYQIFSLGELSPEARARAYRKWLNDEPEYGWNAENKQTLNAFCDLLGIRCNKWEYDGYSAQLQISVAYFCSIGLYFLV